MRIRPREQNVFHSERSKVKVTAVRWMSFWLLPYKYKSFYYIFFIFIGYIPYVIGLSFNLFGWPWVKVKVTIGLEVNVIQGQLQKNAYLCPYDLGINMEGQYASFLHLTLRSRSKVIQGQMQKNAYLGPFDLGINQEDKYASFTLDLEVKVKGHSRSDAEKCILWPFWHGNQRGRSICIILYMTLRSRSKVIQGQMQKMHI